MHSLKMEDFPSYKEYFAAQDEAMNQIEVLADSVVEEGVQIGKILNFGVADGHATYVIAKVNKATVEVWHVPYMDAYHFQGVYLDKDKLKLPFQVAEQQCRRSTFWKKLPKIQPVAA